MPKKLSSRIAYNAYVALPKRSIAALRADLASKGYHAGREKLAAWKDDERWDETIAATEVSGAAVDATIVLRQLEELGAEKLEDTFADSARMIQGVAQVVTRSLEILPIATIDDARTLAGIVSNVSESLAKVQKILAEAHGSIANSSATTAAPAAFDEAAYRKMLGLSEAA